MTRIGVLSDTHGDFPHAAFEFFRDCDEIWHGGDFGNISVADNLKGFKPLRGVCGNIDSIDVRMSYPEYQVFTIEKVKVLMIHIGGYPGRYSGRVTGLIRQEQPKLLITGHSHILKVMFDKKNNLLHINPGAAGNFGFHKVVTMVRFAINGENLQDLEIFEKQRRH